MFIVRSVQLVHAAQALILVSPENHGAISFRRRRKGRRQHIAHFAYVTLIHVMSGPQRVLLSLVLDNQISRFTVLIDLVSNQGDVMNGN